MLTSDVGSDAGGASGAGPGGGVGSIKFSPGRGYTSNSGIPAADGRGQTRRPRGSRRGRRTASTASADAEPLDAKSLRSNETPSPVAIDAIPRQLLAGESQDARSASQRSASG